MDNTTTLVPPELNLRRLVAYMCYVVVSGSVSVCCFVVFVSIWRYKALHSNAFIVVGALCLADSMHQFAYASAGVYRLYLMFAGTLSVRCCSAFQCMLTLHNMIWIFTEPYSNLMLAVVSIDRLISVVFPLPYIGTGRAIGRSMVTLAVGYSSLSALIGLLDSYKKSMSEGARYPAVCILQHAVSLNYRMYISGIRQIFASSSLLFYTLVPIFYKRHNATVSPEQPSAHSVSPQQANLKRQRHLTRSMGLSCACTFFVLQMPMFLAGLIVYLGLPKPGWLTISLIIVANLNPLCNVCIFLRKQKELRKAVLGTLRGKILPANVELW